MNNLQVHLLIILKVFHFLDLVAVNGGNEEDSDELDKEQEAEEKESEEEEEEEEEEGFLEDTKVENVEDITVVCADDALDITHHTQSSEFNLILLDIILTL